ncbi:hypothetical protein [Mucilaginibacter sp.]
MRYSYLAYGAFALAAYFVCGCARIPSCNDIKAAYANDYTYNMVLREKTQELSLTHFYGTDLTSEKDTVVNDGSKQTIIFGESFRVGDTLIKNKGDATIHVKRKGKKFDIDFDCTGY